jgi:tetratricopeptide (TPR) repeat protein
MSSVNLGVAYAVKGDLPAAERSYRQALEIEPGLFEAELNLGNLLRVTGRATEAIPHLERALERSPRDADALRELQAARATARESAAGSSSGVPPRKP